MRRKKIGPDDFPRFTDEGAPLPPLQPYKRCTCGVCHDCQTNAKWDRVFAKFAASEQRDEKGWFRSPLSDF